MAFDADIEMTLTHPSQRVVIATLTLAVRLETTTTTIVSSTVDARPNSYLIIEKERERENSRAVMSSFAKVPGSRLAGAVLEEKQLEEERRSRVPRDP